MDEIPFRTFVRWTGISVAALVAAILLGMSVNGFWPAPFIAVLLYVFRPPRTVLTDADIEALLRG